MRHFIGLALLITTVACGSSPDGSRLPTAPSVATNASSPPGSGATLQGTVVSPVVAAVSSAAMAAGLGVTDMTVEVVGTGLSAPVDGQGRFTLGGLPAGDLSLHFQGSGVNATATLPSVKANDTITIVVTVSSTSASIVAESRNGQPSTGTRELEGRIEAVQQDVSIVVAGITLLVPGSTVMREGDRDRDWSDLRVGVRVHVTLYQEGSDLVATFIEIQNTNADLPVELNGTVAGLAGNASAFEFTVSGRLVKGNAQTQFFGDGDRADSFASLSDDQRVEVKGLQRDGYVYATRIHINGPGDDNGDGQQDSSASIHGTLKSKAGSAPLLVLVVDNTTVRTSADTRVKRRGDVQSLDALQVGQSLHVIGTRRSDGSLEARDIEIDDDAVDGEFEIEGSLGGLKGTCPSISFGVNGYSIVANGATSFKSAECTALKNGNKVRVKGIREASGSVLATEIERR